MTELKRMRKVRIIIVYYIDLILHSLLIIGWSSIRQMLENEGFFLTCLDDDLNCKIGIAKQATELSQIFNFSMMLAGPIMLLLSIINDFVGYGVSRSISYLLIILSYSLLAISTPENGVLQYVWVLHHPAALAMSVNTFTLCSLYPAHAGLLINLGSGLMSSSSMVPQAWLAAVNNGLITRSQIFYIWFGLAIVSFIITTLIFPWHSVTDPEDCPNLITVMKSEGLSIFRPPTEKSLVERIRQCSRIMRSPIFWSHVLTKIMTHYALTLSLTVANDMMKNSVNALEVGYETLQTQYDLTRGITSVLIPVVFGFIMNNTIKLWNYTSYKGKHDDLQYSTLVFVLQAISFFVLAGSICMTNVWLFLLMPSLLISFMQSVFFTNLNFCYPVNVRGMFSAFSNTLSLTVLWTQRYIISAVQLDGTTDLYFYSQLGLGVCMVLLSSVVFLRIMSLDPSIFRVLDQTRVDAMASTLQLRQSKTNQVKPCEEHQDTVTQ